MYHVHRRRRLTRPRKKMSDQTAPAEVRWQRLEEWMQNKKTNKQKNDMAFLVSSAEARTCGRLGVLFPHWLEVPQEGALLWHVPPTPMEKEDGPVWFYWIFRNLQTRRGTGEATRGPLRNAVGKYELLHFLSMSHILLFSCMYLPLPDKKRSIFSSVFFLLKKCPVFLNHSAFLEAPRYPVLLFISFFNRGLTWMKKWIKQTQPRSLVPTHPLFPAILTVRIWPW